MGPIVRVDVKMTGLMYREMLEKNMIGQVRDRMPAGWFFQQDNDPQHNSKFVTQWLKDHKVDVIEWAAQSSDLNHIEDLWNEGERRILVMNLTNLNHFMSVIEAKWTKIPLNTLIKLLNLMPRRFAEVIKQNGQAT